MKRAPSPLRGRYLVRQPLWNAWLRFRDSMSALRARPATAAPVAAPRRVLLAVGGHLGDAVIATTILPQIRSLWPRAEIGVLCGSWSRVVFAGHPAIARLHVVDHWKLNRSAAGVVRRWLRWRRTRTEAIRDLTRVGYDAALDLYPYYPNSARLLRSAGIPARAGFTSGGDGPLFTHAVEWVDRGHVAHDHRAILAALTGMASTGQPEYDLPRVERRDADTAREKLLRSGTTLDAYVVVHAGAGTSQKEWIPSHWHDVISQLADLGFSVVLTGAGSRQALLTRGLAAHRASVADLCDRLTWKEFQWVVANARAVITVDTVAMHLAGAAGTPCIALMTGMDSPARWRALGGRVQVLTEPVECSPCYLSSGCAHMTCVRGIPPDRVLGAATTYLKSPVDGSPPAFAGRQGTEREPQ